MNKYMVVGFNIKGNNNYYLLDNKVEEEKNDYSLIKKEENIITKIKRAFKKENPYGIKNVILGLVTFIGAFGGFPEPPKIFIDLVLKHSWIKWILVFFLVFQGAGGQDPRLASIITLTGYVIYLFLDKY